MKTILIAHNYSEISFASMSYHFSQYLAGLGYDVVFISHQPHFEAPQVHHIGKATVTVLSWPHKKRPTSFSDFAWFARIYLQYKPDIVIGHFVGSNIAVTVSKLLSLGKARTFEYYHTLSAQLANDQHQHPFKKKLLFLRKRLFYKWFCDRIICPSGWAKQDLEKIYDYPGGIILPNPMMDRFENKAIIPDDRIIISFLGRLDPSKGVIQMLAAFNSYKNKNPHSAIKIRVAGTGSEKDEVMQLIEHNDAIEYWGTLAYDKIDSYLSGSHFTIIPSKFDNLPTVGLESMMNQTALLISNTTGLTNYLADGKECYKFDAKPAALEALFDNVENNFKEYRQMGTEARTTFLKLFSMEEYCRKFYEIVI